MTFDDLVDPRGKVAKGLAVDGVTNQITCIGHICIAYNLSASGAFLLEEVRVAASRGESATDGRGSFHNTVAAPQRTLRWCRSEYRRFSLNFRAEDLRVLRFRTRSGYCYASSRAPDWEQAKRSAIHGSAQCNDGAMNQADLAVSRPARQDISNDRARRFRLERCAPTSEKPFRLSHRSRGSGRSGDFP